MTLSDRIERTILLPVPCERVWDAVTKPEQFARWFGVVSDMDFRIYCLLVCAVIRRVKR